MEEGNVLLHVYEITGGLARALSPMFLGKQIDGVWHTGIVVYNEEFYFGSMGIQSCKKGEFLIPNPTNVISLGKTEIPYEILMDHLKELGSTTFRGSCYHLFDHNCNTFSNELAMFLTGNRIPAEITNLPNEIKDTPIGMMLKQFLDNMQSSGSFSMFPEFEENFGAQPINRAAGCENLSNPASSNSAVSAASKIPSSDAAAKADSPVSKLSDKSGEPVVGKVNPLVAVPSAVIYDDTTVLKIYPDQRDVLKGILPPNEFQSFEEVFEYLSIQEIDWSLSRNHIGHLCSLVIDDSATEDTRSLSGLLLALALSRPDVRSVCIHDSSHSFLNVIKTYNTLPLSILKIAAKCLCNFVAENESTRWLLQSCDKSPNNFSESAFALCTHCLLDENEDLKEIGCGISRSFLLNGMVSGDIAIQIGAAIIEIISSGVYSEQSADLLWFCFCECVKLNEQIVELAKTMGLDLKTEEEKCPSIVKYTKSIHHFFL